MAATTTLSTDAQVVNNSGDTAQLIIVWTIPFGSGDTPYDAKTEGVRVLDWGKINWAYDMEDTLLVPGQYSVTLGDSNLFLRNLFFDTNLYGYGSNPVVTLKINGVVEYIGTVTEDSTTYDVGNRSISFTCDPNTTTMNNFMLFEQDGTTPVNPFGYAGGDYPSTGYPINLTDMLTSIFQKVDPAITYASGKIEIFHDWLFWSTNTDDGSHGVWNDQIPLSSLQIIPRFFFGTGYGVQTLGDVLRRLATDFCSFTGLIHQQKAFFKKLFRYDSGNTQSLGTIINRVFGYKYGLIDYVYVTAPSVYAFLGDGPQIYEQGTNTHLTERTLERTLLAVFHWSSNPVNVFTNVNYNGPPNGGGASHDSYVLKVEDPNLLGLGGYHDIGEVAAAFWYHYRGQVINCRIDKITTIGITYDFLKDFVDDGRKYQPIGMEKDIANNLTTIDAIYLGLNAS